MSVVIVTGSGGLIGSAAVARYCEERATVIGIDCDARAQFFGMGSSVRPMIDQLIARHSNYQHIDMDIRDQDRLNKLFKAHGHNISLIVHTAAQPSHDWAASQPITDFTINALATTYLLEAYRDHCPEACFVFTSTNKVYGDTPNRLPLQAGDTRLYLPEEHPYAEGIDESMSIDHSLHSLFGVSKVAADLMVQEYGRNFGLKTGVFRAGCLTGEGHQGAKLHGFLSYLARSCKSGQGYTVFGYEGKQVRDNLHARDVISAMDTFAKNPRPGEVYNIGGGPERSVSVLEAIARMEKMSGSRMTVGFSKEARVGDHRWWVSDMSKFKRDYPQWAPQVSIDMIFEGLMEAEEIG